MDWKSVKSFGASLQKVCGIFELHFHPHVPDGSKIKIKVTEDKNGSFVALLNVSIRGEDGYPSGQAGLGDTPEQALQSAIICFNEDVSRRVGEKGLLENEDFCWISADEFLYFGDSE